MTPGAPSAEVERRGFRPDPAQAEALRRLDDLVAAAAQPPPPPRPGWRRLFGAAAPAPDLRRGVYLWGPPGRGKSLLMDCAQATAPAPVARLHFFEFFQILHRELHTCYQGRGEPVRELVRDRFGGHRLVCFDEFHIHDIADAMLLQAFLEAAVALPGRLVLTSNYPPGALLDDSRFRERFARGLAVLERHFEVVSVDGGADYRARMEAAGAGELFLHPLSEATGRRLEALFAAIEPGWLRAAPAAALTISGRRLECRAAGRRVVWTTFEALCAEARAADDYIAIAERFGTVMVSGVTAAALAHPWTAQRLVWLVDVLYDRRVRLVLSAEAPILDLLAGAEGIHDRGRLESRLREMSSWLPPVPGAGAAAIPGLARVSPIP